MPAPPSQFQDHTVFIGPMWGELSMPSAAHEGEDYQHYQPKSD